MQDSAPPATALTPPVCSACGCAFTPRFWTGIKKWSKVCLKCGTLNVARFLEEVEPDATIAEISAGEQAGAWLRELVGPNTEAHGAAGGDNSTQTQ